MRDNPTSTKRRRYDAAFRAEALRLAGESRSTQAAARGQYGVALVIGQRIMVRR